MEIDGNWKISSVVVLSEEGGFSEGPESFSFYLSVLKMPATGFLGRDCVFLGASDELSR